MPKPQRRTDRVRANAAIVSALSIGLILLADWATGPDINLDIFYAGPVIVMSRFWGTRAGLLAAVGCSLVSVGSDVVLHSASVHSVANLLWNGAVRGVMLAAVAVLYGRLLASSERSREQATLFQSIVEASNEAIGVSDLDGRLVYVNRAHERLFGRPLSQVKGQRINQFLVADSPVDVNTRFMAARDSRLPWMGVVQRRRRIRPDIPALGSRRLRPRRRRVRSATGSGSCTTCPRKDERWRSCVRAGACSSMRWTRRCSPTGSWTSRRRRSRSTTGSTTSMPRRRNAKAAIGCPWTRTSASSFRKASPRTSSPTSFGCWQARSRCCASNNWPEGVTARSGTSSWWRTRCATRPARSSARTAATRT